MNPSRDESLRPGRLEFSRLSWALAISLVAHLLCYSGYELGKKYNIWNLIQLPPWLTKIMTASVPQPPEPKEEEIPLVFVDVNPKAATPEAPQNPKFYSDKNSKAANPESDKDTGIPKINGKQTQIVKADDVPRTPFDKLKPSVPNPQQQDQPAQNPKPKAPDIGDLAMAKPDTNRQPGTGTAEQSKPRTIKEALQRQNRNQLAGEKMQQDGGTSRIRIVPSFDAKGTSAGAYDAAFIEAVDQRWNDLLESMSYEGYRRGRVVLKFRLTSDGRITDMQVLENTVTETLSVLCQKAVVDPAPFDKWPREMRQTYDKDYRDIQFAFYYN